MIPALMPTYQRADLAFSHGEGCTLFTEDGRAFLDFGAGIATSSLGHGHPHLVRAIADQAARVIHVSNLYRVPQAEQLAARLVAASFADSVFFCNSGAEANEGLVKMIRRAQSAAGHPERYRMIGFSGAFHGRTLAMLAATGNAKYLDGFGPAVDGFDQVPFGNLNALRDAIGPHTAGILVEPIQGEGGIRPADAAFLAGLRAAADEFGLYLGFDEVQCGMGRTGRLFAHQWTDTIPDVMSIAKGIAGGFPMGAILARETVAAALTAGSHGTTFGGNPLAAAAANAVLDVILVPGFLDQVTARGRELSAMLAGLVQAFPDQFTERRGSGLMQGLACRHSAAAMQAALRAEGLLVVAAAEEVLRFIPPLIVSSTDITQAGAILHRAAAGIAADTLPQTGVPA